MLKRGETLASYTGTTASEPRYERATYYLPRGLPRPPRRGRARRRRRANDYLEYIFLARASSSALKITESVSFWALPLIHIHV
eukprot:COSAG06_NODE_120_length_23106_cov_18.311862_8_plen_83_part_00